MCVSFLVFAIVFQRIYFLWDSVGLDGMWFLWDGTVWEWDSEKSIPWQPCPHCSSLYEISYVKRNWTDYWIFTCGLAIIVKICNVSFSTRDYLNWGYKPDICSTDGGYLRGAIDSHWSRRLMGRGTRGFSVPAGRLRGSWYVLQSSRRLFINWRCGFRCQQTTPKIMIGRLRLLLRDHRISWLASACFLS